MEKETIPQRKRWTILLQQTGEPTSTPGLQYNIEKQAFLYSTYGGKIKEVKFPQDHVLQSTASNLEFSQKFGKLSIQKFKEGYNCTMFGYSSYLNQDKIRRFLGKEGLYFQILEEMFSFVSSKPNGKLKIKYLCGLNYSFYDLCVPSPIGDLQKVRVRTRSNNNQNEVFLTNTVDILITRIQDGKEAFESALFQRNIIDPDNYSSMIITFNAIFPCEDDQSNNYHCPKFNLVVMPVRRRKTRAEGEELRENTQIASSLPPFSSVVNALTRAGRHVPYRNSSYLYYIKDSFEGNYHTTFVSFAPVSKEKEPDAVSSLRMGQRCGNIKNSPLKPEISHVSLIDCFNILPQK